MQKVFIVGAPKCGTTTIFHWCKLHPEISVCSPKEPAFFCGYNSQSFVGPGSDEFMTSRPTTIKEYEASFQRLENAKVMVDASTDYLHCQEACERIKSYAPNSKIIICLRNPIERAYSQYQHTVRDGLETLEFIEAFNLSENRRRSGFIPLFHHYHRSKYAEYVSKYIDLFGVDNVLLIDFSKLKKSPESVMKEISNFLEINYYEYGIPILNSSSVKFSLVAKFLRAQSYPTFLVRILKSLLGIKNLQNLQRIVLKVFTEKRQTIYEDISIENFRSDIEQLSKNTNCQFAKQWLK